MLYIEPDWVIKDIYLTATEIFLLRILKHHNAIKMVKIPESTIENRTEDMSANTPARNTTTIDSIFDNVDWNVNTFPLFSGVVEDWIKDL